MAVDNFIHDGGTFLILVALFGTNVSGKDNSTDLSRMCIPAAAEASLNSSSCYPLVNFTRPFCRDHGVVLPSYVYRTPFCQNRKNHERNKMFDAVEKLGISKLSRIFSIDVTTIKKCLKVLIIYLCHDALPSCDRTRGTFVEQKVCRESCLKARRICGEVYDVMSRFFITRFPKDEKKYRCELQPYRNAGDSPECYYIDLGIVDTNSTGPSLAPEWSITADCWYLNGSSYHGNISVTATGTPCQSWTEQCPHRHTMNKTYPELNNAENYCRNPQNSGKRPWCFTTDRKKRWEYCDIPKCVPVDGSYGNWSLTSTCNATCGKGFERWWRKCNNPEPRYGGKNCSRLGESVEYRQCLAGSCFVDGNYGNWTKSSPCSTTCGEGIEIWTRRCERPPGKYGGNCSSRGPAQENRVCKEEPCPVHIDYRTIGITVAAVFFVIFVVCFIFILRRQLRKRGSFYYAMLNFSPQNPRAAQVEEVDNISEEVANSSQQTGTSATYQNLTSDGNPIPGFARGVVPYRRDYTNTRPAGSSWYDRLQLIRPSALEWLRNAWGNIDQFGRHVYDVMQRAQNVFSPYDNLSRTAQDDFHGNDTEACDSSYDTLERPPAVLLSRSESPSTPENVELLGIDNGTEFQNAHSY